MFFDEDGDLAHEFYEEVRDGKSQTTHMRRKISHLKPQVFFKIKITYWNFHLCVHFFQGNVYYKNPRLHADFPIPMYSPPDKWNC